MRIDEERLKKLCQKNGILLIILHGSSAKGNVTRKSDIDIGILSRKKFDSSKQLNILNELGEVFGDRFDPVFLNGAEPLISYRVAIHGKPLFEDEERIFQRSSTAMWLSSQNSGLRKITRHHSLKQQMQGLLPMSLPIN
ncbi:MAG: nucleotidyltransferase domain-containing protein [Candidatus Aminicenantes bacterium]|nr:nucleotidyltransferase domain-containing protein [Candidatus Aminicenantes bacterium]